MLDDCGNAEDLSRDVVPTVLSVVDDGRPFEKSIVLSVGGPVGLNVLEMSVYTENSLNIVVCAVLSLVNELETVGGCLYSRMTLKL